MADKTIDQILAEVKAFANKRMVVDDANDFAKSEAVARKAEERLSPSGVAKTYGKVAKDTAVGAAIPASFLGGPVGMAAGGVLAAEGLGNAIEDPSAMNVGQAALGLLPFAGPVSRAAKVAGEESRVAKVVGDMRQTYGAGDMGATVGREVPYRAGSGVSSPMDSFEGISPEPETMMQKARAQVAKFLGANTPKPTLTKGHQADGSFTTDNPGQSVTDMMGRSDPQGVTAMDRMFEESNPVFRKAQMRGDFGNRGVEEALNASRNEASKSNALMDAADAHDNGAVSAPLAHLDRLHASSVARQAPESMPAFEVLNDVPDVQLPDLTPDAETVSALADMNKNLHNIPMSRARAAEIEMQQPAMDTPASVRGMLPSFGGSNETTAMQRLGIGRKTTTLLPERTTLDLAQELGKRSGVNVRELKKYPTPKGTDVLSKALRQRASIANRPRK